MRSAPVPLKMPRDTSTSPQPNPPMAAATSSAELAHASSSVSRPAMERTMPPCSSWASSCAGAEAFQVMAWTSTASCIATATVVGPEAFGVNSTAYSPAPA